MDYLTSSETMSPEMKILRSMYNDHPEDMASTSGAMSNKYVTHLNNDAPASNITKYEGNINLMSKVLQNTHIAIHVYFQKSNL